MYNSDVGSNLISFAISSTPVSETIFFEATVAVFDAKMTEKLHKAFVMATKYPKSKEIDSGTLNLMLNTEFCTSKQQ
jgi:hypothetical protein